MGNIVSTVIDEAKKSVNNTVNDLKTVSNQIIDAVCEDLKTRKKNFETNVSNAWEGFKEGVKAAPGKIKQGVNSLHAKFSELLDYLSKNAGNESPSLHLVTQCMNLPIPDRDVIHALLANLWGFISLVTVPVKLVNDRKFCTHVYETAHVFRSDQGQSNQHHPPATSFCEKIIMYIASHSRSILEPPENRMTQNVMIGSEDYDVPVNLWHSVMFENKKIFFYIHISTINGYKGVLFATDKENVDLLPKIKDTINEHYTKNLGRNNLSTQTIADL